jgi:hypothetical protein
MVTTNRTGLQYGSHEALCALEDLTTSSFSTQLISYRDLVMPVYQQFDAWVDIIGNFLIDVAFEVGAVIKK